MTKSNNAKPRKLKAPFPWPGGKAAVADLVWSRLGQVMNFVEPFAGSLAVLLRKPESFRVKHESCNDLNHYICNFWRAVACDPDGVAHHAAWPVHEADLHARHRWLRRSREAAEFRRRIVEDSDYHDAKIAGWWAWGQSCWIGTGWCDLDKGDLEGSRPDLCRPRGVLSATHAKRPRISPDGGRGVQSDWAGVKRTRPSLYCSKGVQTESLEQGTGVLPTSEGLAEWMRSLANRLASVRVCYGHWSRICDSPSTLLRSTPTGVFLDPPYPIRNDQGSRDGGLYATDRHQDLDQLRDECLSWCQRWGQDKRIRIAVCGYSGDGYEVLEHAGWRVEAWETNGGFGNQKRAGKNENSRRERIWFSPGCLKPTPSLFDEYNGASMTHGKDEHGPQ
jgi:site-specific DNA-adenine methylase